MTDLERGYIAGIVDGEGYIGMSRAGRRYSNRADNRRSYNAMLVIVNTDWALLDWLRERVGGHITSRRTLAPQGKRRTYSLVITAKPLRQLLRWLPESLIIKRPQAVLMREYLNTVPGRRPYRYGEDDPREIAYAAFRSLSSRGSLKTLGEFGGPLSGDNAEPINKGDLVAGVTARLHAFRPVFVHNRTAGICPRCGGQMYRYDAKICRVCWRTRKVWKARRPTSAQPEAQSSVMT